MLLTLILCASSASQKLIDKACDFRFIAEELAEFGSPKHQRSHAVLGDHGRCGRLLS